MLYKYVIFMIAPLSKWKVSFFFDTKRYFTTEVTVSGVLRSLEVNCKLIALVENHEISSLNENYRNVLFNVSRLYVWNWKFCG